MNMSLMQLQTMSHILQFFKQREPNPARCKMNRIAAPTRWAINPSLVYGDQNVLPPILYLRDMRPQFLYAPTAFLMSECFHPTRRFVLYDM